MPNAKVEGLLKFLEGSPTPFHAVENMKATLTQAGFQEMNEEASWAKPALPQAGFVVRNGGALIAFRQGKRPAHETGFHLAGSHTDSPCLKVKPQGSIDSLGYVKWGVEVYGGVLLSTWFDRDLSIAGRVSYCTDNGKIETTLVDFKRPVATLPNLAIHLSREVNESRSINKQWELPPILWQWHQGHKKSETSIPKILAEELSAHGKKGTQKILGFELSFYDTQKPSVVGLNNDFIASARLDNLLSVYCGLHALIESSAERTAIFVANDHEEVGSETLSGAQGTFLASILERLAGDRDSFHRAIAHSTLVSTDNAHGIHPNYPEKHDREHAPLLNHGPAIKVNASQRYATNSETAALFARVCEKAEVPYQSFVSRTDMPCGSTIGPLTATKLGIKTVDVGLPTFAMHSIRELAGVRDPDFLFRALKSFYEMTSQ